MDNVLEIIETEKFSSYEKAHEFINKLTNHDAPLREAVAYKLVDLFNEYENYFLDDFSISKILDGIIDINPNVGRSICLIIKNNDKLKLKLEDKIIDRINLLLETFLENEHRLNTKNHAKNKKEFALYWYLEALCVCFSQKNEEKILKILKRTLEFENYTIREKTAKILSCMQNPNLELLQKAKEDLNFYVKMQVYDKMRKSNRLNRNNL